MSIKILEDKIKQGKTNDNAVGFGSATAWPYLQTVDDPWSVDNRVGNPKAAWSYDFSTYQLSKNILCVCCT